MTSKSPDSYVRKQTFFLPESYDGKRSGALQKAVREHADFPLHYSIQSLNAKDELVERVCEETGTKQTMVQVSVRLAPAAWCGSEIKKNKKSVIDLTDRISFVPSPPDDHVFFTEICLADPIPLDQPLVVEEKELYRVKGVCVYNADHHSLCIYRHKAVAPLQKLISGLCVHADSPRVMYCYSPEMMKHRISILKEKEVGSPLLTIQLYEQLPGVTLEELCNLLLNAAIYHKHTPHMELEFVHTTKYKTNDWNWNENKNKELLKNHVDILYQFKHGPLLLKCLLNALCCNYVVDGLFEETVLCELLGKEKDAWEVSKL